MGSTLVAQHARFAAVSFGMLTPIILSIKSMIKPGDKRYIHQKSFHRDGITKIAVFLATASRAWPANWSGGIVEQVTEAVCAFNRISEKRLYGGSTCQV
jgi:hypothetical protein